MAKLLSMIQRVSLVLLAVLSLMACKDKDEDGGWVWDIPSDNLVFELQDKSGSNLLLMEGVERTALLESLSINYERRTYKFKPEYTVEALRALPTYFAGFTYALRGEDKSRLSFGELYGASTAEHKVEFVWGNGKVETIVFKKIIKYPSPGSIDVQRKLYINGREVEFGTITLVKPD